MINNSNHNIKQLRKTQISSMSNILIVGQNEHKKSLINHLIDRFDSDKTIIVSNKQTFIGKNVTYILNYDSKRIITSIRQSKKSRITLILNDCFNKNTLVTDFNLIELLSLNYKHKLSIVIHLSEPISINDELRKKINYYMIFRTESNKHKNSLYKINNMLNYNEHNHLFEDVYKNCMCVVVKGDEILKIEKDIWDIDDEDSECEYEFIGKSDIENPSQ
jgi:hypothetical protein